jgi:hypothetical protein
MTPEIVSIVTTFLIGMWGTYLTLNILYGKKKFLPLGLESRKMLTIR